MKRIDGYDFGRIEIEGECYRSDLIIYPDRIDSNWWRKQGHLLQVDDLQGVVEAKPEVLVVGTGRYGMMAVPAATRDYLAASGIELIVEETPRACQTYNRLAREKRVVAALHLTC
jgi:hypothetical protein